MYLKVVIECQKCGCSFELRPKDFKAPEHLDCPNCGQRVPEEITENLKVGIAALGSIPYQYPAEQESLICKTGFTFRVKELSESNAFSRLLDLDN